MSESIKNRALPSLYVVFWVAAAFVVTLSVMLFLQSTHLEKTIPLEYSELEALKDAARTAQTDTELKEQIRQLDLISRRGWFLGLAWKQMASRMLAWAALLLLLTIAVIVALRSGEIDKSLIKPQPEKPRFDTLALALTALFAVVTVNALIFANSRSASNRKIDMAATVSQKGAPDSSVVGDAGKSSVADSAVSPAISPAISSAKDSRIGAADMPKVDRSEFFKNWPAFRGALNSGISLNHVPVIGWSNEDGSGIVWKAEVPMHGFSSPVVWENHLFITGGDDSRRAVFAYDAATGQLKWTHYADGIEGSPAKPPKVTDDTGYAAATPATDGNRVFAIFATGDLVATDFNGQRLWAKNLGVPENMYGFCSSPVVDDTRLYIQYDNEDRQVLYCFDAATGDELWHRERDSIISWSSPMLYEHEGLRLVVIMTCLEVEAYDAVSGEQKWTHRIMGGEVAPSATFWKEKVYVANENAVIAAINAADGKLLWKNGNVILPDVSSPVAFEDMVLVFTSAATISCVDAGDGTLLWEKDVDEGFYNSPLLLSQKIVAFDKKGRMLVVKPDRENLIIEHQESLGESVLTTPALVGDRMWVRGAKFLYCLQNPGGANGVK